MTADEYQPSSVKDAFAGQGLPTPPIPAPFVGKIQQQEEWLWTTCPAMNSFEMYMLSPLFDDLTSQASNYWAASFGGHGYNSYSMNLFVTYGFLVLYLQEGWAGAYMDENQQRPDWKRVHSVCAVACPG